MITIKLMGGLGNQMFQYAFIKSQAKKNNQEFAIETGLFENNRYKKIIKNFLRVMLSVGKREGLNTALKEIRQNKRQYDLSYFQLDSTARIIHSSHLPELRERKEFSFDSDMTTYRDNVAYIGYFNTEKYFSDIKEDIRSDFQLKSEYLENLPKDIKARITNTNSVSIHVRRGDYVSSEKTNTFHGTCGQNYYKRAIDIIKKEEADPKFFVFSDDIDWCQNNLSLPDESIFVSGLKNYEDLTLMSICKHNIIANSTFSWWGAWLNNNKEKIVIAPKRWLNTDIATPDIIPQSWLKI